MRRILPITLGIVLVLLFALTLLFLYRKSQAQPVVYETETPFKATIIKKTVATGSLVPRREIEIKPRVSGVVEKLFVEAGAEIKQGQDIARIKIIPNVVSLNQAEAAVDAARINFENAKREETRYKGLAKQQLISEVEFARYQLEFKLRQQELQSASSNLQLVKSGAAKGAGKVSNVVTSTVDGMVIDVPVKEGTSVTETNNFNPGSTIASVADMGDMIFQGKVDESEVGKIKVGMPLEIVVGAIEKQKVEGVLEYIAPKGVAVDGAIQFEIKAAIKPLKDKDLFIRAGYSANADIVVDKRIDVMAVHESVLQFEKDGKPFVEVQVAGQQFEKRPVEVGVSDGVQIELLKGLDLKTAIKKPIMATEKKMEKEEG
ncbi:MAG TPA: efflux RND transporter periplasmic adaptor subunit [Kofleriaceae bacterium]|nr:efflux RND transporter periplasmic adaptor subunit [Kofleriaceae bacterium]